MIPRLLILALLGASAISAAPVSISRSTSEPTKATVMVASTVTVETPSSTIIANPQAHQREWTSSAPALSKIAWKQPVGSGPAVEPVPTEPVWTPSISAAYTESSTPTPTSTADWIETHRQNSSAIQTGWITGLCVLAGIAGLGLIWYLTTLSRKYLHGRASIPHPNNASDVEVNADSNSQAPAFNTPPRPAENPTAETSSDARSIQRQSQDLADMPRLADRHDGLTRSPRRLFSVCQNNIPPQQAHWPQGETKEHMTWTRGIGHREP